ncbi:MAG: superoxide dismutase, Ni [Pirellulales bacterium]|nr:superoxide dismutase, Ni [Pirellulales bacterium]
MKRLLVAAVLVGATVLPMSYLAAHCEVPCGIYDDAARFTELREDQATIAKAIGQIRDLAGEHDPNGLNQLSRWVATKESHATNTQHIVAQYFMTQKIKSNDSAYVGKLTAAHGVMVAAMKCKQSADPAAAEALKSAIDKFQKAYGGAGSDHK